LRNRKVAVSFFLPLFHRERSGAAFGAFIMRSRSLPKFPIVEDTVSVSIDISNLDQMQSAYKAAVDAWIAAIRHEEELASGDHTLRRSTSGKTPASKRKPRGTRPKPPRKSTKAGYARAL
jgi:hypothetical protein